MTQSEEVELKSIDKRLSNLEGAIQPMMVLASDVARIVKALDGNSHPGIIENVTVLGVALNQLQDKVAGAIVERKEEIEEQKQLTYSVTNEVRMIREKLDIVSLTGCRFGQDIHRNPKARERAEDKFLSWKWALDKLINILISWVPLGTAIAVLIKYFSMKP
jgi:hypothetical protein